MKTSDEAASNWFAGSQHVPAEVALAKVGHDFSLRRLRALAAAGAFAFAVAGCACDDDLLFAEQFLGVEFADAAAAPDCKSGDLTGLSKSAARYARRADPKLLEISRRDAEKDCAKKARPREAHLSQSLRPLK